MTSIRGRGRMAGDEGYVLPLTALLLIPMMILAAMATDVGAWYIRADQAQRTADAAALAGTVWLPDLAKATEVARDVAARNGFRDPTWVAIHGGDANATVEVPGISGSGGLQVNVLTDSPSYFGALVLDSVNLERQSVAAVTKPVHLGNPSNALGTGNLHNSELGITPDGIWLSLNAWCQDHQQGDPFSVGFYGAAQAGGRIGDTCNFARVGPNPTLNPDGYTFVIDVPPGAGATAIEIFEPGLCNDTNNGDLLYSAGDGIYANGGPRLNFRVFANDNTDNFHDDNLAQAPVAQQLYATNACTGGTGAGGRWYQLYTIPAGPSHEGRWYVQANVRQNVQEFNLNSFALRARPTADTQLCSSMLDATCPELYALDWLSIYRPGFGGGAFAGTASEFFLAEIDDEHAGNTAQITMFDPGEGMHNVQFLDPDGNVADFEFRLANCSIGLICTNNTTWPETNLGANDNCGGNPCLLVTNSRFQDQYLVVQIDLPASYNCGGNCWWKVRYTPQANTTVTDRTTWSVKVIGGPVHLVE